MTDENQAEFTYKDGANNTDQVNIRNLAEAGWDVAQIAAHLRIKSKVVKAWMPEKAGKGKGKQAAAE